MIPTDSSYSRKEAKMKKIEGKYKIIFGVLILYIVLMAVLFGPRIFKGAQETYLLIGSSAKWKYDGSKWRDFETDDVKLYAWKNYDIYIDQKKFGNYQVTFSEKKWYLFKNDQTPVSYQGDFLGIKSNRDYQVGSFERLDLDEKDMVYVNQVYENHQLKPNQRTTDAYKVVFDLDSDGEEETIYTVSNLFPDDFAPAIIFNFVFVVDHGKIQMVYETTDAFTKQYNHCKIRLQYLIDVDDNQKYELILNCNYYSTVGTCTSMYQKKGGRYQRIKACNHTQKAL